MRSFTAPQRGHHSAEADLVAASLTAAWQRAADLSAPVRSIPGISRIPLSVEVSHVPA